MLLTFLLAVPTMLVAPANVDLYVGTYTVGQASKGIYRVTLNTDSGTLSEPVLAGEAVNPSYLAIDPSKKFLYAVNESKAGEVGAFAIQSDGSLNFLGSQSSKGRDPCHLVVAPGDKSVLAANYTSGSLASFPIQADGSLAPADNVFQNQGTGPDKSRQEGPHMHAVFADTRARYTYACDLGTDEILIYKFDAAKGEPELQNPVRTKSPHGSGPRHGVLNAQGRRLYVDNELMNTVSVFDVDQRTGGLKEIQNIPTLPEGLGHHGSRSAEIVLDPNGKWLYVSNRGYDSIAAFRVLSDGRLSLIEIKRLEVKEPRGFAVDPSGKWLVVGGQNSNDLQAIGIDPHSGALTSKGSKVPLPSPVCVLFPQG